MKVRKFLLENEKGQQFRMDNLNEGCFLTSPTNLGYSYNIDFVQLKMWNMNSKTGYPSFE